MRKWVARQRGWQLPTLEQCRAEWSRRFPDTKWDENAASWQGERAANWSNADAVGDGDDEPF
jgi:hypothetical protein